MTCLDALKPVRSRYHTKVSVPSKLAQSAILDGKRPDSLLKGPKAEEKFGTLRDDAVKQ